MFFNSNTKLALLYGTETFDNTQIDNQKSTVLHELLPEKNPLDMVTIHCQKPTTLV